MNFQCLNIKSYDSIKYHQTNQSKNLIIINSLKGQIYNTKYQQFVTLQYTMRVSLSKNDNLVFNKFLRKYKEALGKFQITETLSLQQTQNVLEFLGFTDQYMTDHSEQLVHSVAYMLSEQKDCIIQKGNLFEFLRIIADLKKYPVPQFVRQVKALSNDVNQVQAQPLIPLRLGSFTPTGQWNCTPEQEIQVKKIFGSMNLKRISRQKIEAQQKDNSEFFSQQTFKPHILDKSRGLAKQRYKKVSLSKSKVQDRLILNQSLQKNRLQAQKHKSIEKQMKECYFKPKINNTKTPGSSYIKYVQSMNTSFENKENDKSFTNATSHNVSSQSISRSKISLIGDKLLSKGKEYEQHLERMKDEQKQLTEFFQMKECTFQPKLCQKAYSHVKQTSSSGVNSSASKVRNVDKSIERMKQARKRRQFQNQVKQRGYPQNIAWTKFMNSYKSQKTESKTPILCIDLKIMDSTRNIKVYEGQGVEEISERICVENSVPHEFWNRVENLLKCSIEQCSEVKIHQNRIYLNK